VRMHQCGLAVSEAGNVPDAPHRSNARRGLWLLAGYE
jgi:hypothetical protein